jgi:hypothetical protein
MTIFRKKHSVKLTFGQMTFKSNDHISEKAFSQMNFRSYGISVIWLVFQVRFFIFSHDHFPNIFGQTFW